MFCVYCDTKLPDEARFCFMCGKKVEPADNAENIVAANSGSIDEEGFGIEIQEAPTTSSSEKNPATPELAIEEGLIEDAHDAFATANESGPDETSAEDQSSEQARDISESADENDHDEAEEAQGSNSAELDAPNSSSNETTVIPLATSSSKTTVIPLAAPSDKTTILPGFGAKKRPSSRKNLTKSPRLQLSIPMPTPLNSATPRLLRQKVPTLPSSSPPHPLMAPSPPLRNRSITPKAKKRRALANAPFLSPSLQSSQCLQRPPHSACHSTFYPTSPLICGYQSRQ